MIINTNMQALVNANSLSTTQTRLNKSLARLSSGSRIVQPGDDAAGLAMASRIDAEVNRVQAAKQNIGNAISFTQTQHGFLDKISKALDRMSELAILAQDGTKTDADRGLYQKEFEEIQKFITSTASKEFNGVKVFSATALDVAIDPDGTTLTMAGIDLLAAPYSTVTAATTTLGTITDAATSLTAIKNALTKLGENRASIGAYQSRLNNTMDQLTVGRENLIAASSRIKDANIAEESTEFAKQNILMQSGTSMLAQANQLPQAALKLLQ
jgi:flagellin